VSLNFDDLNAEAGYNALRAYGQSKLANILFTHELARRLRNTGVTANCVHPGVVATNLWRGSDWISRLARLFTWFYKNPDEGADGVLYLASAEDLNGVTGQYFDGTEAVNPSPDAYDEKAAARLWRESLDMVGLEVPAEEDDTVEGSP
jgi:NAD(P)-dependent dehydrogenase (short-subunit alcohol dehydrogenase family)